MLRERAPEWVALPVADKAELLRGLLAATARVAPRQVRAACEAKGLSPDTAAEGEEWLAGVLPQVRTLRRMLHTVERIRDTGTVPIPPSRLYDRAGGRLAVNVLPDSWHDRLLFPGFRAEVRLQRGVTRENLREHVGGALTKPPSDGRVAVVLGAGNVASIAPLDVVHKLFVDGRTVLLKLNPVNDYLQPFLEESFAALIDAGYVRIATGGADVGAHLCEHADVDEIHITGSEATHDAIVWGTGEEGAQRRERGEPRLTKAITSELGNVSPVIVVPGHWSAADLRFHAESVATQMTQNGGFNCNAAKVLVTHAEWPLRHAFLDALGDVLRSLPPRRAYYPGAQDRWRRFVDSHRNAKVLGRGDEDHLPPVLLVDQDPAGDVLAFREESFCCVTAETALQAPDTGTFLRSAVTFANQRLHGTLNAGVIVDAATRRSLGGALDRAIDDLRYGTVAVNHWAAIAFALGGTTWGAYPGHTLDDVGSGIGWVHGAWLLDEPEKSVVEGPFRVWPKPPWFVTQRNAHEVARRLVAHEAAPSALRLPGIAWHALRG
jgi:acyl-CoA reductase-like NAD-dependent aldehyde dehydrogenase